MNRPALNWRLVFGLLLAVGAGVLISRLPAVAAGQIVYWLAFLTCVGLTLIYLAHRASVNRLARERGRLQQTSDLYLATIEALARAIDAKDQVAERHGRRVQFLAGRFAEALDLDPEDIQGVKTAALLHNVGKLAVPEHILTKPGPLTPEEFQKLRIHPQVGAEIVAGVPFPYSVAPAILSQHERWDGQGYPQGLAGEHIPIGARILTIVKYYDAVTAAHPNRKGLNHDSAIGLLRHECGRALDPKLVEVFIRLLPSLIEAFVTADAHLPDRLPAMEIAAAGAAGPVPGGPTVMREALDRLARGSRESHVMYDIAQSMNRSLGVTDTMALISAKLAEIIPWSGCVLFLRRADSTELRCRFASGEDAPRLLDASRRIGERLTEWDAGRRLLDQPAMALVDDQDLSRPVDLRSTLVCPLTHGEILIGAIALYHPRPGQFSDDHHRLLEQVATQAGAVIHNSIAFEQAQADSLTDPLTLLPNRRSLSTHLARELARADRLKNEVALLVLDLDDFKAVNDTYGHQTGDRALSEVAAVLRGALRPYDLCVRYGGDEFVVVLGECSRTMAEAKRRELQDRVGEIEFEASAEHRIRLSASAGAAVFPQDGTGAEALIASADAQMYIDKSSRPTHSSRATLPG